MNEEDYLKSVLIAGACSIGTLLLGILLAMLLSGCKAKQPTPIIETVTETRTEYQTDTVFVPLPAQSAEVTTRDTVSVLETDLATSTARILGDGSLWHKLVNKDKPLQAYVPVRTIYRTQTHNVPVYVDKPVEVERKMSWWERFRLRAFYPLAVVVIGYSAWRTRKWWWCKFC